MDSKENHMNIKYFNKLLVLIYAISIAALTHHAKSAKKIVANPLLGIIENNFNHRPPHNWNNAAQVEEGSWCGWVGVTCGGRSGVGITQLKLHVDGWV